MINECVTMCENIFADVADVRPEQLAVSGRCWRPVGGGLHGLSAFDHRAVVQRSRRDRLQLARQGQWLTVEDAYENWIGTREPPLFGTEPDARVWALANEAADPTTHRVLDIGGGTGRNALALARRGHPVDVVELTPKFAEMIRADAEREALDVRVIQRDVFTTIDDLRRDYRLILLSEVVSDFRNSVQLRGIFELATQCLAAGGRLVFNAFLARNGYLPDGAARELGQQCYTSIFTQQEMSAAASGLPLRLMADDSVYEYEHAHLPDGAWPPTSWYADWVSGLDVFDLSREECPIEMRWLVYQKPTW